MALRLTVLGCDGGYPGPGGAASGYLVRGAGTTIWMDAGSGTLANLQRHVGLDQLDAVVISHEHPDHRGDLEGLAVALSSGDVSPGVAGSVGGRPSLAVYAPAGLRRLVYHDAEGTFDWHQVASGDQVKVGGLDLSFSRTDHGPETLAVRIDGEAVSLGYSADSGPGWSLEALGPGLDLALCEATYLADKEGSGRHLSARQAGLSGREARVARLVLTHRSPAVEARASFEEGSEAYGAAVELATTGGEFQL